VNEIIIRELTKEDYPSVSNIYREGIETKNATFETEAPDWEYWNKSKLPYCRLCAVIENEVVGWAALSPTSSRYVYRGINEVSIYISTRHSNKGAGKKLMRALIDESEKNGVWTLYASIFPENKASIHLHKSFGFRKIGYMEKAGCMDGVWRDTVLLERRSKITGV
jgi:L-amino acid N-acyltransferase YncA